MIALALVVLAGVFLIYRQRTWRALTWPEKGLRPAPLQAHRGYWVKGEQENTLAAFREARRRGYRMCELDVHLSADGVPVVFHDKDLKRLRGRSDLVKSMTARELAEGAGAPTLEAVLLDHSVPKLLNIEIKSDEVLTGVLELAVADLVRRHRCEERVMFSSFNPLSVWRLKKILPEVPRALLATQEKEPANKIYLRRMWLAPYVGVHALHLDAEYVTPAQVATLKARGIPVALWTVNEVSRAQTYLQAGALSVISDSVAVEDLQS